MVFRKGSIVRKWLETDPSMEKLRMLVRRRRLAPNTAYLYTKNVKQFVDYLGARSPTEALERLKGMTAEERFNLLNDFIDSLLEHAHTSSTVQVYRGVKKWLVLNDVEVDWDRLQREFLPPEESVIGDRIPTKEELSKILSAPKLSLSTKIAIHFMAFGGLRPEDLTKLTYASIKEDLERNNAMRSLRTPREKRQHLCDVHSSRNL